MCGGRRCEGLSVGAFSYRLLMIVFNRRARLRDERSRVTPVRDCPLAKAVASRGRRLIIYTIALL